MNDEEYQSYLKTQVYADLLSIRNSLNRAAYPGRYDQVIAEIDARDKMSVPPTSSDSTPLSVIPTMNSRRRTGIVVASLAMMLAVLALAGVKFADKPVRWMPGSLLMVLLLLWVGIGWAMYPRFSKITSTGMRYAATITVFVLAVTISSYAAFTVFCWLWFLFGGSL